MLLGSWLRCSSGLGRIMPNIEKLLRNQQIISQELSSLKTELNNLENLFLKLKNEGGSKSLSEENAYLEKEINSTKQQLIQLEVARGVQQISLPKRECSSSDGTVKSPPVPVVPLPVQHESVSPPTPPQTKQKQNNSKQEKSAKQGAKEKQNKPDPKKGGEEGGGEAGEVVDVSRLDLRIGKIIEAKKHPDADSLYVSSIDIGKDKPLTVVSGLVKHVPIEEMQGRMVVLLCNLKPAKMRGVTSEAMVMCASTPDKVEILQPPQGAQPGDIVNVDGFPPKPDPVLNPKKKIFEAVAPDLKTDSNLEATYKGHVWTVPGKGNVKTSSLTNVNIK